LHETTENSRVASSILATAITWYGIPPFFGLSLFFSTGDEKNHNDLPKKKK